MDWKVIGPSFVSLTCTHHCEPVQFTVLLYKALKLGAGVGGLGVCVGGLGVRVGFGVGGGVNTGRMPATPVTWAYLPDIQHNWSGCVGLWIIQY